MKRVLQEETRTNPYTANVATKATLLSTYLTLYSLVAKIMACTNSYQKVLATIAHWLVTNKSQDRKKVLEEPTVYSQALGENLVNIVSATETDHLVRMGKLFIMASYWSQGRWNTKLRLGKGTFCVLRVPELPILAHTSQHTELIMLDTHIQDHKGAKITLWRSCTKAWIWRGGQASKSGGS